MSATFQATRWFLRGLAVLVFMPICVPDPILRWLGEAWVVEHQVQQADAIVVLGGGVPFRPVDASQLYRAGFAPRVLILAPPHRLRKEASRPESLDFTKPHHATAYQLLRQGGVPAAAIEVLPKPVTSTRDEAIEVAKWAREHDAKRLLIPTNQFHTRRVTWIFRRQIVDCECLTMRTEFLRPERWWEARDGVASFQSELIKMIAYRLLY